MRRLIIIVALLLAAAPAHAQSVFQAYAGANGIFFDDGVRPSDFEIGGNVIASLSLHISAVGSGYYGFQNSYVRGTAGVRVTATDVTDPGFSIGAGIQYHASSEPRVHAEEWAPDLSVGWVPYPERWAALTLVAQGYYGLTTNQAYMILGARWALGGLK